MRPYKGTANEIHQFILDLPTTTLYCRVGVAPLRVGGEGSREAILVTVPWWWSPAWALRRVWNGNGGVAIVVDMSRSGWPSALAERCGGQTLSLCCGSGRQRRLCALE